MPLKALLCGLIFTAYAFASAPSSTIDKIFFVGNVKVPTKKLLKVANPYMGTPLDIQHSCAIAKEIEAYYHRNNYVLTYASVDKMDQEEKSLLIRIGKYADFDAQAIGEMKRRDIKPNVINKIFFDGNEKISTQRLMNLVRPSLGLEKNSKNIDAIALSVQEYYRSHRYELAYTEVSKVDENGTIIISIKKYPTFKARYAREGKI
ncbi:MAG: POTRA domain-containing protein [Sulfuricurvum sp.]|uniref:POTRA domain-containing protein n=1 Tax=Sulfuricurvum sp. TaxID=2025608 RepID=UPI0027343EC3|nr:POTRA domain-containing protein [Sulfuricurvum sp.]MDP2851408.1 POTRA domain-containing protein [Sulfuricurvum sp.]